MTESAIRSITFDLWDTLLIDDSDEPKRAAQGLGSKPAERCALVQEFLERHEPVSRELLEVAYATTNAAFRQVWYGEGYHLLLRDRHAGRVWRDIAAFVIDPGGSLPSDALNMP